MGRSRGGLTSKIHALVDSNGLPVRLALSPGEAHDVRLAGKLLSRLKSGSMLLADRGYDANWIRELTMKKGALGKANHGNLGIVISSLASGVGAHFVGHWRRRTDRSGRPLHCCFGGLYWGSVRYRLLPISNTQDDGRDSLV